MSKKKYVIEKAFENMDVQKIMQLGVDANGRIAHWTDSIGNIEELNSDYINEHYGELQDDAYKRGYKDGRNIGIKDGMCEAWEAAKKLFSSMADSDIEKAFPIEWNNGGFKALMNLQPQEAIAKLKAYEDKRSDRIEVGDEVIWKIDDIKLIITSTYKVGGLNWCDGVAQDGKVYSTLAKNNQKTGKHYDIQSIFGEMKNG